MIDKIYGNLRITIDITHKSIEENFICISDATTGMVYFKKTGNFNVTSIDNGVMAISKNDAHPSTVFFMYHNDKIIMRTFKKDPDKELVIDEELKKRKLVIVNNGNSQVVFDYENNAIISPEFDEIVPKGDLFSVKIKLYVVDKELTLTGYLDPDGNLIDKELYSPLLNTTITVDDTDIRGSIARLYPTIEKMVLGEAKKIRKTQILDFEYEAYKRRRQKR